MKQLTQVNSSYEERLQAFKQRHNLQEVNTSKEAAAACRVSDFTMRLSRSTGQLLGTPAPKHKKYGRTVRYYAADLMEWHEQGSNQEAEAA
ncbi:hypothetical protein [Paraglaciecola sp. 25GB23A]|uniref:hypothetical protein n=1 Tax=Paraglaciecola sp. 25GB23A TaxID=3156068 RepID=UPI0032AFA930